MTLPPAFPCKLKTDSGEYINATYFDFFINTIKKTTDEKELNIDYSGLYKIKDEFVRAKRDDKEYLWNLCKALNAWSNHFSELGDVSNILALNANTEKIKQIAVSSTEYDIKNATNGKRGADKDPRVVKARMERNCFESLQIACDNKVKFFDKSFYISKDTLKDIGVV